MVATALKAGSLAIIHVNSDDPAGVQADTVSFVLLKPIGSGTVIYFTDRTWTPTAGSSALNAGSFSTSGTDGTFTYTAGADLPAGTIITITTAQLAAAGINISDAGEALYAYQGTNANTPTSFLYVAEVGDGSAALAANIVNTGLIAGTHTTSHAGDNVTYGDRGHNINLSDLLIRLGNPVNWSNNDNSPHVPSSGNFFTAPDQMIWAAHPGPGGLTRFYRDGSEVVGSQQNTAFENPATPTTHFYHPNDIVFDTAHGLFFVADSDQGNRRILQGNIADLMNPGANPTLIVIYQDNDSTTAGGQFNGIAIDADHTGSTGALYFVNKNNMLRVTYDHDGTTSAQTPTILASLPAGTFANEIALDIASNRAWILSTATSTGAMTVPAGTPGAQFDPDTGTWYIITTVPSNNEVWQVSGLDRTDTGTAGTTLTRVDLNLANAGGSATGAHDNIGGYDLDPNNGILSSIDFHAPTNTLYFVTQQHSGGSAGTGGVYTKNLTSGAVTNIFAETGSTDYSFEYIDVDPATGRIYISNAAFSSPGNPNGTTVNDSSIFIGQVGSGTFTKFADAGNINGSAPQGLIVQNAPTLTGAAAGGLAVTEASSAPNSGETARVTLFTGLTASDIDTGGGDELAGAQVRISNNFVRETASTATGHTATQDYLRINGLESGTIAGSGITFSYDAVHGVMTLSGPATVAEYKAALELVQFSTSGDNVTNDGNAVDRTVSVSVFDGLLYSDEIHATVSVTGINDAPVNTAGVAMNYTEDTTGVIGQQTPSVIAPVNAISGISIGDADADASSELFTVTLSVTKGTLNIRTDVTGGLTAGQVAGNGTGAITINATQDAINATLAATVTNAVGGAANGLVYTPIANYNGADTLTIITNDQGNNGNDPGSTGTGVSEADIDFKTLNIADVNDAPIVSGDGTEEAAAILEDTPWTAATALTVAQLFQSQFDDPADKQYTLATNPTGSQGDAFAGIAVIGGTSSANGVWQFFSGGMWIGMGSASVTDAKLFNASTQIRFVPNANYNGPAPSLVVHLVESSAAFGDGISQNVTVTGGTTRYSTGTVTLSQTVTAVNDAPVNTVGAAVNTTEDVASVALTGMSVADVEATGVVYYILTVQNGTLTLRTDVAGGLTAGQLAGNGTNAVAINATIGQINATLAALNGVRYTPTANFTGADTLTAYVNDNGQTGQDPNAVTQFPLSVDGTITEEDYDTRTINVAAVNDPVTTSAPATLSLDEDAAGTAVTGLSIADLDATLAPNGVYVVTLSSTNGTMTLSTLTGLTFSAGDGTSDATMTFRGTLADLNAALATATYSPTANYHGTAQIQLQATDTFGGVVATGTGAATSDSDTIAVTVNAVNDPVVTVAPGAVSLNEDAVDFAVTGLSVTDADAAMSPAGVYEVTLTSTQGTLKLTTVTGLTFSNGDGDGDVTMTFSGTLADINAALATAKYTPNADYNGAAQITLQATDTFGGVVATGSGPATADGNTIVVTVNSVNDEPAGTDDDAEVTEGTPYVFTVANFKDGFSDAIDADELAGVRITTLPATGTIFYDADGAGAGAPVAILAGADFTVADLMDGKLTYVAAAGSAGTTPTFTFQVRDDGGVTNGGVDLDQSPNTFTLNIIVAGLNPVDDTGTTTEDATTTIDVLSNDLNTDANSKVTHIEGTAIAAGETVTLASGAKVTLNADGTLTYDPNGVFNKLTGAASGGTNTSDTDTFDYTATDGGEGTVTVTVNGVVSEGDDIVGGPGDNYFYVDDTSDVVVEAANAGHDTVETGLGSPTDYSALYTMPANVEDFEGTNAAGQGIYDNALDNGITMAGGNDLVVITGGGDDSVNGAGGDDFIYVGTAWSAGDSFVGGAGYDTVGFLGGGTITFGTESMGGIEQLSFYGDGVAPPPAAYSVTMHNDNLAAGKTLLVTFQSLLATETATFDGSAELDGNFTVIGGGGIDTFTGGSGKDVLYGRNGADILNGGIGNDVLVGGSGADQLTGGAGKDIFRFESEGDSNADTGIDTIVDFNVGSNEERIDLTAIDANTVLGGNQAFTFIGSGAAFTNVAGQLRVVEDAGNWFVEGDTDGDGTADLVIQVSNGADIIWGLNNFLL